MELHAVEAAARQEEELIRKLGRGQFFILMSRTSELNQITASRVERSA
jgi:hypothetical protein